MLKKEQYVSFIFLMLIIVTRSTYAQVNDTTHNQNKTFEYDTIFIPADTIRYVDTVFMYYDDTLQKKIKLQAEVFFSPLLFSDKYSSSNLENEVYGQLYEEAHSPGLSYTFGANMSLAYKNILFQTGINYTQFNENFDYKSPTYLSFDTNIYIIPDTLDTYYIVEGADTSWFYITEENEYTQIDTIQNQNHSTAKNTYSYFEFPLVFGYTIDKNSFSIFPKAGFIIGLLQQTKGKTIDLDNYQDISELNDISGTMFTTVPISIYLSLGVQYQLAEKTALLMIQPAARKRCRKQ